MKPTIFYLLLFTMLETFGSEESSHEYRKYDESTPQHVKEFYHENHRKQTVAFVRKMQKEYSPLSKKRMGIWDAIALLDQIVDESDPDIDLEQSYHAYQTAEAIRKDGHPRWLILTGFIHDLGKMLTYFGEPQWAVVGDTFPVGCAYSKKIVFPDYFQGNPDFNIPEYQTRYGIYLPQCGLKNVLMSWGHDEYLYQVVKNYLPKEASYIIRFHSFYAHHHENAYEHLLDEEDHEMLPWLKLFSQYDLYSKVDEKVNVKNLRPYYEELLAEYFPKELDW